MPLGGKPWRAITTGQRRVGCDELTSDNTTIDTPQEVRFVAGELIALSEFTVEAGSHFVAEIDGYLNSDNQDGKGATTFIVRDGNIIKVVR